VALQAASYSSKTVIYQSLVDIPQSRHEPRHCCLLGNLIADRSNT